MTNAVKYYYVVVPTNWTSQLEGVYSNEANATPQHDMNLAWYNLQWPPTIPEVGHAIYRLSAVTSTTDIYGAINIEGATNTSSSQVSGIVAQVGYGPGTDPSLPSWKWFPMTFNPVSGPLDDDEYMGTLLPTAVGTFNYTTRWSADGGAFWYYAQEGPNGSPSPFGTLTVSPPSDSTPPPAPTNLRLTGSTNTSISLQWNAPAAGDLYAYEIWQQDVTGGIPLTKIATVLSPSTTYTDAGLITHHFYNYVVKAVDNSFNVSGPSNTLNAEATLRPVDVTINVTVPAGTPGTVYLVGDFGVGYPTWTPGAPQLALTQVDPTHWTFTFQNMLDTTNFSYKFVRGSNWDTVEKTVDGQTEISDRTLTVDYGTTGTQTVNVTVANWRDPFVQIVTPANGASARPAETIITLAWNQPMPATPGNITVTGPNGPVAGTFTYDVLGHHEHTFTPSSLLVPGSYIVNATGNVDAAGGDRNSSHSQRFSRYPILCPVIQPCSPRRTIRMSPRLYPPSPGVRWWVRPNTNGRSMIPPI